MVQQSRLAVVEAGVLAAGRPWRVFRWHRGQGVYGRLRATRPGEYVLLDTTPLDVFALATTSPATCKPPEVKKRTATTPR